MKYIFIALAILLSGCTYTSNIVEKTDAMRLIERTSEVAPDAVWGEYVSFVLNLNSFAETFVYTQPV